MFGYQVDTYEDRLKIGQGINSLFKNVPNNKSLYMDYTASVVWIANTLYFKPYIFAITC